MTPTLLSASSAAYLAAPATGSDSSAASVDGSALSGTASDESSDDHRDDAAPDDFAVLLAAMMAPVAAPARSRVDLTDASTSWVSAPSAPSAGDAVAATSVGLGTLVPLPSPVVEVSGPNPVASETDTLAPASPTPSAVGTAGSADTASATPPDTAGVTPPDSLDATRAPAGADRTVARTSTMRTEGADPSRIDALTQSVIVPSSMTEREMPAPTLGLIALDRPLSLGRATAVPLAPVAPVAEVPVAPPTVGLAAAIGPTVGTTSRELSPVDSSPLPAEGEAVWTLAAMPAGPPTALPSAPLHSLVVPLSGDDEALDATSAEDSGAPLSVLIDASGAAAPPAMSQKTAGAQNAGYQNSAVDAPAPVLARSVGMADPMRVSREEPSAPSNENSAPSTVGVTAGPAHASLADRPTGVEAPTLPVVDGVRPGDTSQHIVRAAQRAQAADGAQQLRLEMHPGDLGAVAVEVTIEGGAVHVAMVAERGETKDLLRSSIGELRASLVAAGFAAGRVDIQSGLPDGRFGQPADRQDAWSQSFDRPDSRRDQSGAFANMFDQTGGRGDQSRRSPGFSEFGDRRDVMPASREVHRSDRQSRDPATAPKGSRRDRLDLQL